MCAIRLAVLVATPSNVPCRPDLKLIIMSATLHAELLSHYFCKGFYLVWYEILVEKI